MVIGLTGGIGSGKTTVAKLFENLGVPVYFADKEAKLLMNNSSEIKAELTDLFGKEAYLNDKLNKPFIANQIFNDKRLLDKMNAIVHPKVGVHFEQWLEQQEKPYIIKEVAIIFENNLQSGYDLIITVIADKEERISRVIKRDNSSREKVLAIMKNQLEDLEKAKLSDFVIVNNDIQTLEEQVHKIHTSILQQIENNPI